jgi:hypothetical protein
VLLPADSRVLAVVLLPALRVNVLHVLKVLLPALRVNVLHVLKVLLPALLLLVSAAATSVDSAAAVSVDSAADSVVAMPARKPARK